LAIAAVLRPPRRLHVGRPPGLRSKRAQGGCGVKGAGAHLHVVGLQNDAALVRPIALKPEDQVLERGGGGRPVGFGWLAPGSFSGRRGGWVLRERQTLCAGLGGGQVRGNREANGT